MAMHYLGYPLVCYQRQRLYSFVVLFSRDKFLGGRPLCTYNAQWVKMVDSPVHQTREYMFRSLWYPALAAMGRLPMMPFEEFQNIGRRLEGGSLPALVKEYENFRFALSDVVRYVQALEVYRETLNVRYSDPHVLPQTEFCTVCRGDVTHVVRLEDLAKGMAALGRQLGLAMLTRLPRVHAAPSLPGTTDQEAWRTLSQAQKRWFLEYYAADFDLLGYSMEEFED